MVASIAVLVLAQYGYGSGNPADDVKRDIQRTYDSYARTVLKRDLEGTMKFFTPDVVWVYPDGKTQKGDEIRSGLKEWEDSITKGSKLKFTIDKFKIDSDDQIEAWVTMHFRSAEMIQSKTPERTSQWHDTWVKSHGNWKNSRGEVLVFKVAK